jgi:hypothetical protein
MGSYSTTATSSFTVTHARRIASKVATDLQRFHRFYGRPPIEWINNYEQEVVELMQHDAIDEVTYGFKKNGQWVTAVKYKAVNGTLITDDSPGGLRAGFDVEDAGFGSYLVYSSAWDALNQTERERIRLRLPFRRTDGDEPAVLNGYWSQNRGYAAGGYGLQRSSIRRY